MSIDEKPNTAFDMVETSHSSTEKVDISNVTENLTAISQPPSPWGKGHRALYLFCTLVYLCSAMSGMNDPVTSASRVYSHNLIRICRL